MTATLARPAASATDTPTITEARTGFLDLSRERVVLYDGSMGATILNMQLTAEDYGGLEGCNENLVFVMPDLIQSLHAGYFEIGDSMRIDETPDQGELFLRINDDTPGNGNGAFQCMVQVYRNE